MKVQLEPGVWIANGRGDPPRTLIEENAREFNSKEEAFFALARAREFRPFENAEIQEDLF